MRTDGLPSQRNIGAVRVYAVSMPSGARVIGVIEVHAINDEANVERLMPTFMKRVADLGGSGAMVDAVVTHYEERTGMRVESYAFPCGRGQTCWGSRFVPYVYTVRLLSIQGRALVPDNANARDAIPSAPPSTPTPNAPPSSREPEATQSPPGVSL
ncbi:MAG: hypothetical protein NVSMB1_23100 [Polyangiales bacterium]